MTDLLFALPSIGPRLTPHRIRMEALLSAYQEAGLTLAVCCDRRHLGRAPSTLKRYARRLALSFPDYTPRAMRRKR